MLHRREVLSTKDEAGKNAKLESKVWKEGDRSDKGEIIMIYTSLKKT